MSARAVNCWMARARGVSTDGAVAGGASEVAAFPMAESERTRERREASSCTHTSTTSRAAMVGAEVNTMCIMTAAVSPK